MKKLQATSDKPQATSRKPRERRPFFLSVLPLSLSLSLSLLCLASESPCPKGATVVGTVASRLGSHVIIALAKGAAVKPDAELIVGRSMLRVTVATKEPLTAWGEWQETGRVRLRRLSPSPLEGEGRVRVGVGTQQRPGGILLAAARGGEVDQPSQGCASRAPRQGRLLTTRGVMSAPPKAASCHRSPRRAKRPRRRPGSREVKRLPQGIGWDAVVRPNPPRSGGLLPTAPRALPLRLRSGQALGCNIAPRWG